MGVDHLPRRWLRASEQSLAAGYDVALLDLDGVVYLGSQPIVGAAKALADARAAGMRIAFITNNASRDPAAVAAHLVELGVPAAVHEVVTSAQAAASVVCERLGAGASVLVIGSPALSAIIEAAGLRVVASPDDRPDAVVQGFWSELCYQDFADAAVAVSAGALWVATNLDATLPSPRGLLPGNGSLVGVVATTTGRTPIVAGKPQLPLHAEGVRRFDARHPLVVGDRLDTDIEGANAAETDSLLVLTGVTSPMDLLHAPTQHRPTYIANDLDGLLVSQPEVTTDEVGAHCGGWFVRRTHMGGRSRIDVDGEGAPIDAVRALLACVWTAADNGDVLANAAEVIASFESRVRVSGDS